MLTGPLHPDHFVWTIKCEFSNDGTFYGWFSAKQFVVLVFTRSPVDWFCLVLYHLKEIILMLSFDNSDSFLEGFMNK